MSPDDSLARIRRFDGRLRAFVRVFDPPLTGETASGPVFAVKDMIDVMGVPTGGGARAALDPSPRRHAPVVERLLNAGWTAIGKTQTVELAFGAWGTNRAVGGPWNPWDAEVHRAPGGSSSGSAVAVAAGLVDAALGTDTGGSVRIPAAVCGVVGLKPGRGLVSLSGVHPLAASLDTVGTLARDVATAARMLAVISGPDGDTATRAPFDAERALATEVRGARLAATPIDQLGDLDPEVERLYLEALDRFRAAGVEIEMVAPPLGPENSFLANGLIMAGEGWRHWRRRIADHGAQMDPWIVRRFQAGRDFSDHQLRRAQRQRAADMRAFHTWMTPYAGLLSPTCPLTAPPLADIDEAASPLSRLTRTANYLDLPGVSVPCGLSNEGLPVGLQIIGPPGDEASVVALGAAFERVSGWDGRTPELARFEG